MKTVVIYDSLFGNTHELRNEIMEELTAEERVKSEEAFGAL